MERPHAEPATAKAAADVHQARAVARADAVGARRARSRPSFSSSIALETSAFLTANVPPKPQHSSASGSSTSSSPGDRAQQPQRRVADPQQPQRVAGRVVGDRALERRADVRRPRARRSGTATAPRSARHAPVVAAEQAG